MTTINTLLMLGKPGAGKGTQGKLLAQRFNLHYCSTGDHFRDLSSSMGHTGLLVRDELATGRLPSFFITRLLVDQLMRLESLDGIVLDGFARTCSQADEVTRMLAWFKRPYLVINVDISDEIAHERLVRRSKEQERTDSDTAEKIRMRLQEYEGISKFVINYFELLDVLKTVNGEQPIDEVHRAIVACL